MRNQTANVDSVNLVDVMDEINRFSAQIDAITTLIQQNGDGDEYVAMPWVINDVLSAVQDINKQISVRAKALYQLAKVGGKNNA